MLESMAAVAGRRVAVVGAGMAGLAVARLLAPHCEVTVVEQRPDLRELSRQANEFSRDSRRSIGVLLSQRGARAMEQAGLSLAEIDASGQRVYGREVHAGDGSSTFVAWGKPQWSLLATDRQLLGMALMHNLESSVEVRFDTSVESLSFTDDHSNLLLKDKSGSHEELQCDLVIGSDGVNSVVRKSLVAGGREAPLIVERELQPFQYKNLLMAPLAAGTARLELGKVHTWPGDGALFHAMPSMDSHFTCTLILPREGPGGFEGLQSEEEVENFFKQKYPEALDLIPDAVDQFLANPTGNFYTTFCSHYNHGGQGVIIGDAAHATVPFAGQGLNCALEDAPILSQFLLQPSKTLSEALEEFSAFRKPDAHAMVWLSKEAERILCSFQGDSSYMRRTKYQQFMSKLFPSRYPPSLYALLDFYGEGTSVRVTTIPLTHAEEKKVWADDCHSIRMRWRSSTDRTAAGGSGECNFRL